MILGERFLQTDTKIPLHSVLPGCWVVLVCSGLCYWVISAIQNNCIDSMMAGVTVYHLVAQSLRVSSCWSFYSSISWCHHSRKVTWWPKILLVGHNSIHATEHWSWMFPGEQLLWPEIVVLVMEAADERADFRGGNYTSVLTGDSLWDMEYSRNFLIWLLSSTYSDFDSGPRTVTVVNVGASDEFPHNHVWLVIMKSMI
jgi:hypothetical protein